MDIPGATGGDRGPGKIFRFQFAGEQAIIPGMKHITAITLMSLCLLLGSGVAYSQPAPVTSGKVTPTITAVTTNGTVSSGAKALTFIFSPDFTGAVLGVAFSGASDSTLTISSPTGETLTAVAYTVTAGSFRLVEVR
jgi:hypothetical protein